MFKFSIAARWVLIAILLPVVVSILSDVGKDWAKSIPAGEWMGSIAQRPWFYPVAMLIVGLTAGAWLDWLLRRFDGSRQEARKKLGRDFQYLADRIEDRQGYSTSYPGNIGDVVPDLLSAFIRARSYGIWCPDKEPLEGVKGARSMLAYLRIVGTMLADGHFSVAIKEASAAKQELFETRQKRKDE